MVTSVEQKQGLESVSATFDKLKTASIGLRKEPVKNRKERLLALRAWIKSNRPAIQQAIYSDFKKPAIEVDTTEVFPALDEIKSALDNLDRWTKPKLVDAPITMIGTRSMIMYEPKGLCLVISP